MLYTVTYFERKKKTYKNNVSKARPRSPLYANPRDSANSQISLKTHAFPLIPNLKYQRIELTEKFANKKKTAKGSYLFSKSSAISNTAECSSSIFLPLYTKEAVELGKLYVNGTPISNVVPI